MSNGLSDKIKLASKGMAMGIAEVIPGVSGGTIAFVTGIYEQLIESIKSVDVQFIRLLAKLQFARAWSHINGNFLLILIAGMVLGIGTGVIWISSLMESHPEELWGFFTGLILASAIYIGVRVKKWNLGTISILLIGLGFAYFVTTISPTEGSTSFLYVFICGTIAISALILPGVSGSFMLLLLGMYTVVIPAVKRVMTEFSTADLLLISVFGLGCLVGLVTFSRVLSWLFHKYHEATLACLTGIMLGSLNKIWPWRIPTSWMNEAGEIVNTTPTGEYRVLSEENVLPGDYDIADPNAMVVFGLMALGFAIVFVLDRAFGSKDDSFSNPA